MATATWKVRASLIPMIGLLVLAGMASGAGSALAQLDCPLPAGMTPPADPRVTAQQVEDGSASLADFALATRHQFVSEPAGQLSNVGCLVRQDGTAWHSGLTYLVQLTPHDGRVVVHAKDMSLSGRQLKPSIHQAVMRALGIRPADWNHPAVLNSAAGEGGEFRVADIPGAAGYASAYFLRSLGQPLVLVAGFDLGLSHVTEEEIVHLQPAVTAEDVVDRATLKEFVTDAGERFIDLMETGDLSAALKARVAFRDPDGPWIHGPVYLSMMRRDTRLIMFHGAFPDRFELRRGGISRDVATGELIVEQLVAAAESSPEGGFWLYRFDNPADDTDSDEVPKVGYARVITGEIPLPDGSKVSTDFIINSGLYLTSDSVLVQRILAALEEGQTSILFGITTPEDGDVVAGDAVAVTVTGAPTDTVHFAYRLAGLPEEPLTYAGAATNREAMSSFVWDTLDLPDDDYEFVALYTEDDGYSVIYDAIEVSVDNIGDGGGGCAAAPVLPGGPVDPTSMILVVLALAYLTLGRRRPILRRAM